MGKFNEFAGSIKMEKISEFAGSIKYGENQ
jgi:hypothetical protein